MKAASILIIDRLGLVGEPLSLKLSKEFPVVLISEWRKFPTIPDNKYSCIVLIEEEESDKKFLTRIIEKAKQINSDFIFAQMLSVEGKYAFDKVFKEYSSAKAVLYGDIFIVRNFIEEAKKFGGIRLAGEGLKKTYPVFIEDVVDELTKIIFGTNNSRTLSYLFGHPTTELSLAHMIQKADPDIKVDFIKRKNQKKIISFPKDGIYMLGDYPLAKKIRRIDIKKIPISREKIQSKKSRNFPFSAVWIMLLLLISPLFFTFAFSLLGLGALHLARSYLENGNFVNAKSSLHLSQTFFYTGKKSSEILFFQAKIIGKQNDLRILSDDIELGYKVSSGLLQAFNSEEYFSKVFSGQSKAPIDDFTKGQNSLKSAIVILEKIKAEGRIPEPFIERITNISPLIRLASNTSEVIPIIFGLDKPKTYLVLFQNNMELRPGGGFIGSYGILKLDMGRITEFSIHDVYDADGQLKGHVEPPFAIRRYLPSSHWYMRDSNFDVDFVKAAKEASRFLEIETGEKVFGVIGVDVSFVKNILRAIGPVYVPDYKETVSDANLYELTQAHAEKNFFPGSTQKKDFLRSLYRAMQAKIFAGNVSYPQIVQAISDSLMEKHVVFAFNNSNNIQNIFTLNGWSSSLFDERKENNNSIKDFLGISEANLGVNKVNYFIKRQISQKVTLESNGNISEELIISYKNASTSWPGGDYKNYLRIILPKDSAISEISINDVPQSIIEAITDFLIYEDKNFKPPSGLEVDKTIESEKAVFGFLVNIPVGKLVKIKIQYTISRKDTFDSNDFSYNLKIFKQPGVDTLPYSFFLYYPENLNVVKSNNLKKEKDSLLYSENITGDKELTASFVQM